MKKWTKTAFAILITVLSACGEQASTPEPSPTPSTNHSPTPNPTLSPSPKVSTAPKTKTGVFAGGYIRGLSYKTESQEQKINSDGEYQYLDGEKISFFYGNLSFGSTDASDTLDFFSLFEEMAPDNETTIRAILEQRIDAQVFQKVRSIVNVLAMFDTDLDPANGITLETTAPSVDTNFDFATRPLEEFNIQWYARANKKLLRLSDIPFVYYYQALNIQITAHALDTHQSLENNTVYSSVSHIIDDDRRLPKYQEQITNYSRNTENRRILKSETTKTDLASIDHTQILYEYVDGELHSTTTNQHSFLQQSMQKKLNVSITTSNQVASDIEYEEVTVLSPVGDILSKEKTVDTNADGIYDTIEKNQSVDIQYNNHNQITSSTTIITENLDTTSSDTSSEFENVYPYRRLNHFITENRDGSLRKTNHIYNYEQKEDGQTQYLSSELLWGKILPDNRDFYYRSETWHYPSTIINKVNLGEDRPLFIYTTHLHTPESMLQKKEYYQTETFSHGSSIPTSVKRSHFLYDQLLRVERVNYEEDINLDGVFTPTNISDIYIYDESGLLSRIEEHKKNSETDVSISTKESYTYQNIDYGFAYLLRTLGWENKYSGF